MVEYGVLAVEMEASALYTLAAKHGRRALAICTVSDHIVTGEETTSQEREQTFGEMVEIALTRARASAGCTSVLETPVQVSQPGPAGSPSAGRRATPWRWAADRSRASRRTTRRALRCGEPPSAGPGTVG